MADDHKNPPAPVDIDDKHHKSGDKTLPENSKADLDKRLDEAAEESFPASDPVSVKITK
jgi:hypothetical protein